MFFSPFETIYCAFIFLTGLTISCYAATSFFSQRRRNVANWQACFILTSVQTQLFAQKMFYRNTAKCVGGAVFHTSLTDRNSRRGKTRWRSKKWAIFVVKSYSAMFAGRKGKWMCVIRLRVDGLANQQRRSQHPMRAH